MAPKTGKEIILLALALVVLLAACQPAPIAVAPPQSIQPTPTIIPTATLSPTPEKTTEQILLEENGFLVVSTDDEMYPMIALGSENEALVPVLKSPGTLSPENIDGAVWLGNEDQEVTVRVGEDGLPFLMQVGDLIVVFANFTDTTVDVALYQGDLLLSKVEAASLDDVYLAQYRSILAESSSIDRSGAKLSLVHPLARSRAARVFEMLGLMITVTACVANLAFPPTVWIVIAACGSAFINAVVLFGGEDLQIIALPMFVTDALTCLGGSDPLSCVSGVISIVSSMVDALQAAVDQFQQTYAHAFDPPPLPVVVAPIPPAGDSSGGGDDDDPCPCFVPPP